MEFIYKRELDKRYAVKASFYYRNIDGEQVLCRRAADIKSIDYKDESIDAYFIMMNPGKCKSYDVTKVAKDEEADVFFSEAISDPTMARVMNIMKELGWKYIRILNMSDIVEPNSPSANAKIKKIIEQGYYEHCIFAESRREELDSLTKQDAVYVISWGTSEEINYYVPLAMSYLEGKTYIGAQNKCGKYYHVKLRGKENQISVAEQIIEQARNLRSK
ncbi:MAG: hypothetical protein MR953_00120 [Butyrivibrio crossotus]|nr:hypothetical protein [Butyrivibrio crossotus]